MIRAMKTKYSILIIDDEIENLELFSTIFESKYKIYKASDAYKALDVMEKKTIHLVICDQRLPNMSGVEFLSTIKSKWPVTARILMTGYPDISVVIEGINKGGIRRYIKKPWDTEKLDLIMKEELEFIDLKSENSKLISEINEKNKLLDDRNRQLLELNNNFMVTNAELVKSNELLWEANKELSEKSSELQMVNEKLKQLNLEIIENNYNLEESNINLKALDSSKSNFLRNLSHELRTPLVTVRGYTELLINEHLGTITNDQKNYMSICLENIDHLTELLTELLDLSLEREGKLKINIIEFDLRAVIYKSIDTMKPAFNENSLSLNMNISDKPVLLRGDQRRIGQLINHLLVNAVKFNKPNGSITIECTLLEKDGFVRLICSDTGIGIPQNIIDKVFDRFYQADAGLTRKYEGTGIGLSLVRDIVKKHRGTIDIKNNDTEGTSFVIYLPASGYKTKTQDLTQSIASDKLPPLVLIIEKSDSLLELWRVHLHTESINVIGSKETKNILNLARRYRPDCIIVDLQSKDTKEEDGLFFIDLLKKDPITSDIPVITIALKTKKQTAFNLGVTNFLLKPVNHQELVATVKNTLKGEPLITPGKLVITLLGFDWKIKNNLSESLMSQGFMIKDIESDNLLVFLEQDKTQPDIIVADIDNMADLFFEQLEQLNIQKIEQKIGLLGFYNSKPKFEVACLFHQLLLKPDNLSEIGREIKIFYEDKDKIPQICVSFNNYKIKSPTKNLLIADKDPSVQKLLERIGNKENFIVSGTNNEEDLINIINSDFKGIVLISHNILSEYDDSMDLIKTIKNNKPNLPVYVLSSRIDKEVLNSYEKVNADGYIVKPFNYQGLTEQIKNLFIEIV